MPGWIFPEISTILFSIIYTIHIIICIQYKDYKLIYSTDLIQVPFLFFFMIKLELDSKLPTDKRYVQQLSDSLVLLVKQGKNYADGLERLFIKY